MVENQLELSFSAKFDRISSLCLTIRLICASSSNLLYSAPRISSEALSGNETGTLISFPPCHKVNLLPSNSWSLKPHSEANNQNSHAAPLLDNLRASFILPKYALLSVSSSSPSLITALSASGSGCAAACFFIVSTSFSWEEFRNVDPSM